MLFFCAQAALLRHFSFQGGSRALFVSAHAKSGRGQSHVLLRVLNSQRSEAYYGAPFVKILYLTDLAQKLLSLRRDSNPARF